MFLFDALVKPLGRTSVAADLIADNNVLLSPSKKFF